MITREAVAWARCPFCAERLHLAGDMEAHLVEVHGPKTVASLEGEMNEEVFAPSGGGGGDGQISVEDAKAMCARRRELFEAFFGEPLLAKTEEELMAEGNPETDDYFSNVGRPRPAPAALGAGGASAQASAISSKQNGSSSHADIEVEAEEEDGVEASSPSPSTSPPLTGIAAKVPILVPGGYQCAICGVSSSPEVFATRDGIIKHLYTAHEDDDDVEAIEGLVPALSAAPSSPPAAAVAVGGGGRKPLLTGQAAKLERQRLKAAGASPSDGDASKVRERIFSDTEFPCEICGKVYPNESQLLVHIEGKHGSEVGGSADAVVELSSPAGGASSSIGFGANATTADILAELQRRESTLGAGAGINCMCEHCPGKQTIFKSIAALFSHVSAKHPSVDAVAYASRVLEQSRKAAGGASAATDSADALLSGDAKAPPPPPKSFPCEVCGRQFGSADALSAHMLTKHQEAAAAAGMVNPTVAHARYWCNDCERGFSTGGGLLGHMMGKHGHVAEPVRCPVCRRHHADGYALDDHVEQSHPAFFADRYHKIGASREIQCPECPRIFLSPAERRRHVALHHASALPALDAMDAEEAVIEAERRASREMRRQQQQAAFGGVGGGGGHHQHFHGGNSQQQPNHGGHRGGGGGGYGGGRGRGGGGRGGGGGGNFRGGGGGGFRGRGGGGGGW